MEGQCFLLWDSAGYLSLFYVYTVDVPGRDRYQNSKIDLTEAPFHHGISHGSGVKWLISWEMLMHSV